MANKILFFILFSFALLTYVQSTSISTPSALNAAAVKITFDTFATGTYTPLSTTGVTISSSSATSVQNQGYTQWTGIFEGKWLGFGIVTYTMVFTSLVSECGVGIFDPNYSGIQAIAKDINGNILETMAVPVSSPGGGFSTFVGFKRGSADIKTLEIVPAAGDPIGIDNVMFYTMIVPEPSVWILLLIAGSMGYGIFRQKK